MLDVLLRPATIAAAIHVTLVIGLGLRVISNRPATGVALAWLMLITSLPYLGAILYLLIGERRIGKERTHAIQMMRTYYEKITNDVISDGLTQVDWSRHVPAVRGLDRLGRNTIGCPTVCGSDLTLLSDTQEMLDAIARDVDGAQKSILMEFYIWNVGGKADEVLEAVIRASQRGVSCRLLIDALGARPWWKTDQPKRLRAAGVQLRAALPVGIMRTLIGRTDLRLHRKIVIIDGEVAWTGSMNLVDPRYFKQGAGVGEWVDAMVRVRGAAVVPLAAIMIGDWSLETRETLPELISSAQLQLVQPQGTADVQAIASGPGESGDALLQMILGLINAAQTELVMTTPYLVPDDSLLRAIRGAAGRGVKVSLIVPEKVDSFLTRYASRSYFEDLLHVGVAIYLYRGGLLHTKSIMVDDTMSMFGTVNLDMRSFWLNYEVALFVYGADFAGKLRQLQESYIQGSDLLTEGVWSRRSTSDRFLEDSLRLLSPLL